MKVSNWYILKDQGFKKTERGNYRDTVHKITYYKKICEKCGEYFLASRKSLKYCSKECCNRKLFTFDQVKKYIENVNGYKLLSKTYKNTDTKLSIQCPKGHIYDVTYNHFRQGRRCHICSGSKKHTYEYIKDYVKKEGYVLLSETYENAFAEIKIQCNKGHIYEVRYNTFQQGHRCPICDRIKTSSKGEKEVYQIVKELTDELVMENDRTQIVNPLTGHYLELDIYIPSLKKAIEYNGEYWHSLPDRIIKDQEKIKQCKEKGIDLLIIKEKEWLNHKEVCLNQIKELLMILNENKA